MVWQKRNKFTAAETHESKKKDKFRPIVTEVSSFVGMLRNLTEAPKTVSRRNINMHAVKQQYKIFKAVPVIFLDLGATHCC